MSEWEYAQEIEEAADYTRTRRENNIRHTTQTHRSGLSHAGTRIALDTSGNIITPSVLSGTPYNQYLEMRRVLQEQYYGHEAPPSDPDPHRGVPTRERLSGHTVQAQNESNSVEDNSGDVSVQTASDYPGALPSREKIRENIQRIKRQIAVNKLIERPDASSSKYFVSLLVAHLPFDTLDYDIKFELAIRVLLDDSIGEYETEYAKVQRQIYIKSYLRMAAAEVVGLPEPDDNNDMLEPPWFQGNKEDAEGEPDDIVTGARAVYGGEEGTGSNVRQDVDVDEEQPREEAGQETVIPKSNADQLVASAMSQALEGTDQWQKTAEDIFRSSEGMPNAEADYRN